MPVTTVAKVVLVLFRLKIVFCERVWLGVVDVRNIPMTDALVVVPVPLLLVRLRTVLVVQVEIALLVIIPITCELAPVEVNEIESAMVPPTLLDVALNALVVLVLALKPMMSNVPEAPRLVTEMPPMLLVFAVQSSTLKLKILARVVCKL